MDFNGRLVRDTATLESGNFDLLVIGAGIYGVCVAWDAAMRGLKVALVERADFGGATSANSLKTIHGGLRYLQDANIGLIRLMIRERKTWMKIAPHLVHPLSCLMPTCRTDFRRHKLTVAGALALNNLLGYDRNWDIDAQKHLPNSRIISSLEYAKLMPDLDKGGLSGGAIWYDAQAHNTERLLLSVLLSAVKLGTRVANYTEVTDFLLNGSQVVGVTARDLLHNREIEIKARLTVNATGAWTDCVLGLLGDLVTSPRFQHSIALNLVTKPVVSGQYAIAIPSKYANCDRNGRPQNKSRILFAVPWRHYSLIGTMHRPHTGPITEHPASEDMVHGFIDEINRAYPAAALTRQDVYQVHAGYLPVSEENRCKTEVKLLREARLHDHETENGIGGLITVVGVKYTTARSVAEKVVDLATKKLGRSQAPCRTGLTPVIGGQIDGFDDFLAKAIALREGGVPAKTIRHLVFTYGSEYQQILAYLDENPDLGQPLCDEFPVIRAEIVHAVRHEMAQTLADVVFRRTELGMAGLPTLRCLKSCAELMAAELGRDLSQAQDEVDGLILESRRTKKRLAIRQGCDV